MAGIPQDLSTREFSRVARFAQDRAGIILDEGKHAMVQSRLTRRIRGLKFKDFKSYITFVESEDGKNEQEELISLLTTNVTSFFREPHHFEYLNNQIVPQLVDRLEKGGRVRMWSAGCSYGNEAYTMAMICRNHIGPRDDLDLLILASDIDRNVLGKATQGFFAAEATKKLPEQYRNRFMRRAPDGAWQVNSSLRSLVRFRELNLLDPWPMRLDFDVVFCRNVLIYFDSPTKSLIVERLASVIPIGGFLAIGHSERIADGVKDNFTPVAPTMFQRTLD